jgi:hypothetical protein
MGNPNIAYFSASVFNAQMPKEGYKAAPFTLDFSAATSYAINLYDMMAAQQMSLVQGIFCDNSVNSAQVSIAMQTLGYPIVVPTIAQGYFPLLVAKNDVLTFTSSGGIAVRFVLYNMPLPAMTWKVA